MHKLFLGNPYWYRPKPKPKPPRPRTRKSSIGCFGMETLVTTGSGEQKLMRDLRIGDEVLSDGTGSLTKFIGWMDRGSNKETDMILIETEDGEQLTLTGSHIIFYYENGEQASTYAKNLNPGNVIIGGSGEVISNNIILQHHSANCKNLGKDYHDYGTCLADWIFGSSYRKWHYSHQ